MPRGRSARRLCKSWISQGNRRDPAAGDHGRPPISAREHFDRHGILIQGWPGYYPGFPWDDYPETCALKDALLGLPVHQDLNEAQLGHIAEVANQFGRTC